MTILLLGVGGGGGNILRSLKALYRRDLRIAQKSDPKHAERLRKAVAARFVDTNEFALSDVPQEERLIIGAATTRGLGSMHNPGLAREALQESRAEVESLLSGYDVVIVIGTGGKGTGAGTIFPIAQMARQQKKLVIPIFVRPSFEWHEVEKRRHDHALGIARQFDGAGIRMIEILNDRGYSADDPQPQSVVWERMNRPIARGLRGLLYVLWDLSQVDPSDLSVLFGGHGRLRLGFAEIDPRAGQQPGDEQIDKAVRACWDNPYYAFAQPVGTSLICIQGDWSNVVDGKIKARLATLALDGAGESTYNPLYARGSHAPKPWGVTALFAEYTGNHPPLEIGWPSDRKVYRASNIQPDTREAAHLEPVPVVAVAPAPVEVEAPTIEPPRSFSSFREFSIALNRQDPAAVALAGNGAACEMSMDGPELRKIVGAFWFRSVFARLSRDWRDRVLEGLLRTVTIPNHLLTSGRKTVRLGELTLAQLKQIASESVLPDGVRRDLHLLVTVGTLWGGDTLERFEFSPVAETAESSRLALLLHPFRRT